MATLTLATPAHAASAPTGNLDHARVVDNGIRVTGWAWDSDSTSSVRVKVTVAGPVTKTETVTANGIRADVARVFPAAGDKRGFDVVVPVDPGVYTVSATALNIGGGSDKTFPTKTVTVSAPTGNLDHARVVDNGIRVTGWAWDSDSTSSVRVKVTVAGPVTKTETVTANGIRADVARVFPAAGDKRGFDVVVPVGPGTYEVTAIAVNIGVGSDKTFPTKTVTVPPSDPGNPALPGPGNTGVPAGVSLKLHNGDMTIREAGKVIDGLDIRGLVTIEAPNVVIKNSRIRGLQKPTTHRALVTVNSPNHSVTIQDSELAPDIPSVNLDGVRGMNITAERVNIHKVIDHFHIYGDNVTIRDSWLHDNHHEANDENWDGPSHDDNIQIQRGKNIRVENNHLSGAHTAAIIVTQDTGQVVNLAIRDNFLSGGSCVVNFKDFTYDKPGSPVPSGVTMWGNTFDLADRKGCPIISPDLSFEPDLKNNKRTDGTAVDVSDIYRGNKK